MEYNFLYKVQSHLQLNNLSGEQPEDYLIVYDQEDGTPSLTNWNVAKLGPEPTATQLLAAAQQAQTNKLTTAYKSMAITLLAETDWTQYPDVNDASVTPHLLNKAEFDTYRLALRAIVVSPASTVEFPTPPSALWST